MVSPHDPENGLSCLTVSSALDDLVDRWFVRSTISLIGRLLDQPSR